MSKYSIYMDINSWIEEVHRNKHNMIPVVKLAISKPIEALLDEDNLTCDFPSSLFPTIKTKKENADDIMTFLSSIGNTDSTQENQVVQLKEQIKYVIESIIPQINEFSKFFLQFKEKDFYFQQSEGGQRALGLVQKAPSRCEISCQGLLKLSIDTQDDDTTIQSFRLIDVVEDIFDELDNINVIYKCSNRDIEISLNKAEFQSKVLLNISENIKWHAFPYAEYANKLVIDKIVEIEITEEKNMVLVRISNNGNPFEGNTDNLFNSGYHSGKYGRTGFGLASAKQLMQKIGGDIQFSPTSVYRVSFLITIPN